MSPIKKEDWKTRPFPETVKDLPFERAFNASEFAELKQGLRPKGMEDKWFIYYENETLNFHRSWTGHHVYQVKFLLADTSAKAIAVTVNRDPAEYNQPDDDYDIKILDFLINKLLLNKNVSFPSPPDLEEDKHPIYRHSMIGHGRSNKEE